LQLGWFDLQGKWVAEAWFPFRLPTGTWPKLNQFAQSSQMVSKSSLGKRWQLYAHQVQIIARRHAFTSLPEDSALNMLEGLPISALCFSLAHSVRATWWRSAPLDENFFQELT
jgi:hypothetical protein